MAQHQSNLKATQKYIYFVFVIFICFCILNLYEFYHLDKTNIETKETLLVLVYRLFNEVWFVGLLGVFLYPFYYLLSLKFKKFTTYLFKFLGLLLVLIQLALIKYSLTTNLNLGSDLLGYSYDDISLTVSTSSSISIKEMIPIFLIPVTFFVLYFLLEKLKNQKVLIKIFAVLFLLVIPFKFFTSDFNEDQNTNKIGFFVADVISFKLNTSNYSASDFDEFPLLKSYSNSSSLAPYFTIQPEEKPNIVFIIFEGLGTEFVDGNYYSGFTPFIDSLIKKSLYWENAVSTTGRTFGINPAIMGSLPLGRTGFLDLNPTPEHETIFSILNNNNYQTSYYTGAQSSFDGLLTFLEYNEIETIIDENRFGPGFTKEVNEETGFSWGYPDSELYKKFLQSYRDNGKPRLDLIQTSSNHEPFDFPNKDDYLSKATKIYSESDKKIRQDLFNNYLEVFASHLYADKALQDFFNAFQNQPNYNNTIFVITGDHRIIPIPQKDQICRYHVPLIIYSPLLKQSKRFKGVSSHFDVTPSLINLLRNNYDVQTSEKYAFIGEGLDTASVFKSTKHIPLMRYKGNLKDFIYKEYFYSNEKLFKIGDQMQLTRINDKAIEEKVLSAFDSFKKVNAYVSQESKIFPVQKERKSNRINLSEEELAQIKPIIEEKTNDEIFEIARSKAFEGKRKLARTLCNYILRTNPYNVDVLILKGRTFAWDKEYKSSEKVLLKANENMPFYYDSYLALLDMYFWSGQNDKGILIAKKAVENEIDNYNVGLKLAKIYRGKKDYEMAKNITDSLLVKYPNAKEIQDFIKTLK